MLDGTPTLRDTEASGCCGAGDVVCFPTGPGGRAPGARARHGADPLGEPLARVSEYPDSGKVGVAPAAARSSALGDATDYWEGE